jgi:hypothetical protein
MEIRIVIFLAFVSVALITNTLLIWLVYKALSGLTSKVTDTVSQFITSSETNEWIATLKSASEQAIAVTEAAKLRIIESQPVIEKAQQDYRAVLDKANSTLETVAEEITTKAKQTRDVVAGPAFSFLAFAAGLSQVIENIETEE